ncbi:hypothetical protein BP5796_03033 [Coleophoma crateriformis]|uniref:Uncharacterized protein n=1 Tax=Coleophoma crateriformis TaxID=565419 RepID=A0A3D8SLW7_9HELO|nr:hypothetical protein BP5796_03033 [Coleophoma crateriformis]
MAFSVSSTSLLGIPTEIRLKIYSYLLSERNVTVLTTEGTLSPRYQTALFRVNKQIYEEAQSYFHSENALVLVENHEAHFLSTCRRAIPLTIPAPAQTFKNYVLKAQIQSCNARTAKKAYGSGRAIFASRHLANFVRLLNAEHSILRNTGSKTRVDLLYRTQCRYYRGNSRIYDSVTEGIKGIRPIENDNGSRLTIKVHGDLDAAKANEIQMAVRPSYNAVLALMDGKIAKERGNALYKAGDYNAARAEYLIAVYTFASYRHEFDHDAALIHEFETLFINISTNSSLLDSKQGRHKSAVSQARKALEMASTRSIEDTPDQKAKYRFRLGCALADNGQDLEAADELENAAALAPGNISIRAKLKQVHTRLTRHQTKSDSTFRANLSKAFH